MLYIMRRHCERIARRKCWMAHDEGIPWRTIKINFYVHKYDDRKFSIFLITIHLLMGQNDFTLKRFQIAYFFLLLLRHFSSATRICFQRPIADCVREIAIANGFAHTKEWNELLLKIEKRWWCENSSAKIVSSNFAVSRGKICHCSKYVVIVS